MGADHNDGNFRCIKIFLMILYILSLIGAIILLILSIVAIVGVSNANPKSDFDKINLEATKSLVVVALVASIIMTIVSAIGLHGVIKENKCIMIGMTVIYILGVIFNAWTGSIVQAVWSLFIAILTGVFAKKIIDKQKMNFDNLA